MSAPYTQNDLETFWVLLARSICQGNNLGESLEKIRQELDESPLAAVVQDLIDQVNSGLTFSDALRRHPAAFGQHVTARVEGGECSGRLDRVLILIVEFAWRCPDCILR